MHGTEQAAARHYDQLGGDYIPQSGYLAAYHRKRLDSATKLLLEAVRGGSLYDFGCGSGELFTHLGNRFDFSGCDISPEMIRLCKERSGVSCDVGGIAEFQKTQGPFDAVVALNVLPYLSADDEAAFFEHAAKVLRRGGALLISHTNMLFDLVSMNRYTVDFYMNELAPLVGANVDRELIEQQLTRGLLPRPAERGPNQVGPQHGTSDRDAVTKRRVDPFTYPAHVESFGFQFVRMAPLNAYLVPPHLAHQIPAYEAQQPDWVDRLPPTLAKILSTQFQAVFTRA